MYLTVYLLSRQFSIIIIIIIIALQHSEDLDRVNEEQKLVLNEDEVRDCTVLKDYYG